MAARETADLVVVGAGTIGGWASTFAAEAGLARVVVLEHGIAGGGASSRAAGIVRAQGGTPTTVALGRWSIDFYRGQQARYGTDSGFRELGYLILAVTDEDEREGRARVAMQRAAGLDVSWLGRGRGPGGQPDPRSGRPSRRQLRHDRRRHRSAAQRPGLLAGDAAAGVELRERTAFEGLRRRGAARSSGSRLRPGRSRPSGSS